MVGMVGPEGRDCLTFERKSISLFLLFALLGAVVGSLCGELVARLFPDTLAARIVRIGTPPLEVRTPVIWLGFRLDLPGLVFAIVGVLVFRKL